MKKKYPVKSKRSLKENVINILPMMLNDFMSYKEQVVNHPRQKKRLHRMRITGKPMRYIMEIMEPSFGGDFKFCLNGIKDVIELMGEIHDCDVNIPELINYLSEIRQYNRSLKSDIEKFSTSGILRLVKELRFNREKMFRELCTTLDKWEKEDFKTRLVNSLNVSSVFFEMRKTESKLSLIK